MIDLTNILNTFLPIGLAEMENVKLMDRQEIKFAFSIQRLPSILAKLAADYYVLEINQKRCAAYTSLYYDTPDFVLYHQHHNGKKNRYKLRHRTYLDSGIGFFEVKLKNAKGRTIKNRIPVLHTDGNYQTLANGFITQKTPLLASELAPVVWINYQRITLVSKHSLERLTIDTNLQFGFGKVITSMPALVIAEVKQAGKDNSLFIDLMKEYQVRPGSLSKYCMAIGLTYPNVKKNRFKPHFIRLKKYDDAF